MSYSTVDFDTVAPLMPYDKTTSMVAGRGVSFEWKPPENASYSEDPIPSRRPSHDELVKPNFVDLTGRKMGRLSVLGVAKAIPSNGNGQRWVVRCLCGAFETRKAKVIKSFLDGTSACPDEPMCCWCSNNRRLQRGLHDKKKAAAAAKQIQEMAR
jgi:hypothetical protein